MDQSAHSYSKHCRNKEAFQNAQFVRVSFLMLNILYMQGSHVSDILDHRMYPALVFFNFKLVNFASIDGLYFSHSVLLGWLRPFHLQA